MEGECTVRCNNAAIKPSFPTRHSELTFLQEPFGGCVRVRMVAAQALTSVLRLSVLSQGGYIWDMEWDGSYIEGVISGG